MGVFFSRVQNPACVGFMAMGRRKYPDGKKLRKIHKGIYEHEVTIVSASYDSSKHKWMYKLGDCHGEQMAGQTEEVQLECCGWEGGGLEVWSLV